MGVRDGAGEGVGGLGPLFWRRGVGRAGLTCLEDGPCVRDSRTTLIEVLDGGLLYQACHFLRYHRSVHSAFSSMVGRHDSGVSSIWIVYTAHS